MNLVKPRALAKRVSAAVCLVVLVLGYATQAGSWGNEGHRYINRVAAEAIPSSMPRFLRKAADELEYLGPEPDRWRASVEPTLKNSQEPDHFIDLELLDGLGELPRKRYEFYHMLYEARAKHPERAQELLPERVGLQPYITIEIYERLKAAMREYRGLKVQHKDTKPVEQAIIFYAGWMGHYVADASQPMHTSIQYNGWVGPNPNHYTTAKTIHSDFETRFVADNITAADFKGKLMPPQLLKDPFADYLAYLKESNSLVERVYQLEKQGAFVGAGTAEGKDFVESRLAAGAQMLLNLWYTAWIESEKPVPPYVPSSATPTATPTPTPNS